MTILGIDFKSDSGSIYHTNNKITWDTWIRAYKQIDIDWGWSSTHTMNDEEMMKYVNAVIEVCHFLVFDSYVS